MSILLPAGEPQSPAETRPDGDIVLTWLLRAILLVFTWEMLTGPFKISELLTASFFYGCVFGVRALTRTIAQSRAR